MQNGACQVEGQGCLVQPCPAPGNALLVRAASMGGCPDCEGARGRWGLHGERRAASGNPGVWPQPPTGPPVWQMCEIPVNTPENPWRVSPEEERARRDLRRTHLVFSIDPRGCEDVDDALSVRALSSGHLELGVHIADVTHFVAANSHVDIEARTR